MNYILKFFFLFYNTFSHISINIYDVCKHAKERLLRLLANIYLLMLLLLFNKLLLLVLLFLKKVKDRKRK